MTAPDAPNVSLLAKLDDASRFTAVVRAVKDLLNEANFYFEPTGLTIQAMDSSHVALVLVNFPSTAWSVYEVPVGTVLGFSLKTLDGILKTARKDDSLTITAQRAGDDATFSFNDGEWVLDVKCLDIDSERMSVPDEEPDCTWTTENGKPFTDLVERFGAVTDVIRLEFGAVKDGFIATGSDQESKGRLVVSKGVVLRAGLGPSDDTDLDNLLGTRTVYGSFGLKYLKNFTKGAALGGRTQLRFSADKPLCVVFEREADEEEEDEDARELETIRYYLAPKVEDAEPVERAKNKPNPKRARISADAEE